MDIKPNEATYDVPQCLDILRRVPDSNTISRSTYMSAVERLTIELEALQNQLDEFKRNQVRWTT